MFAGMLYPRYSDDAWFVKFGDTIYTDDHGSVYPVRNINDKIVLCTSSFLKFKKCFNNINISFFPLFMEKTQNGKNEIKNVFMYLWYTIFN